MADSRTLELYMQCRLLLNLDAKCLSSATAHVVRLPQRHTVSIFTQHYQGGTDVHDSSSPSTPIPPGSGEALGKLQAMGFPKEAFAGAITSGEVAHNALLHREGKFWQNLGDRCIHLTWGARGSISLEGLGLKV